MSDAGRARRAGLLIPVLVPVGALVFIGLALLGFSRVLLAISPHAATVVAIVASSAVLGIASFVATRRRVSERSMVSLVGAVAGVAMFAGGVAILAFPHAGEEGEGVTVELAALEGASADGFEPTTLTVPADEAFTIEFNNQDPAPSTQHNVQIFEGEDDSAPVLFDGSPTTGPLAAPFPYPIEPIPAGSYFFNCKFHPTTMTGTLEATPGGGGEEEGGPTTEIAAVNSQFDKAEIRLAADTPTTITFDNGEAVIHNLSIYTDDTATEALFTGDDITGPDSIPYDIPAIEAGTYFFRCDFHPPTMTGSVVVEPARPPPGEGAGGSASPTQAAEGG
jgi:plastocyanin